MLLKVFWAPRTGSRDPGASLSAGIEEMQRKMKGFRGKGRRSRRPLGGHFPYIKKHAFWRFPKKRSMPFSDFNPKPSISLHKEACLLAIPKKRSMPFGNWGSTGIFKIPQALFFLFFQEPLGPWEYF